MSTVMVIVRCCVPGTLTARVQADTVAVQQKAGQARALCQRLQACLDKDDVTETLATPNDVRAQVAAAVAEMTSAPKRINLITMKMQNIQTNKQKNANLQSKNYKALS